MKKAKQQKQATGQTAENQAPKPGVASCRSLRMPLLCLIGAGVAVFVLFKFLVPPVPGELVGAWQVVQGPLRGATLEFRSDGTTTATRTYQGKKEVDRFTAKVSDKTIYLMSLDERTG